MKTNKEIRTRNSPREADDVTKKAVKLAPIKKSGKERHMLYSSIEDDEDLDIEEYRPRESVLDYFDDTDEEDQ